LEKGRAAKTPELHRLKVKGAGEQLFHGPTFRRFAQEMRRHRESGVGDLDLPATVETTTQQGGIFTPVYGKRQILPEYLVLIDRASFHDQQARFVDENLARLQADGVFIERYYFDSDPRVCRSDDPYSPHLTLQELAARYPEHRLMIFSDGAGLMHPFTGRPQRWLELFSAWADRAVLTLEAPRHWGYREMALSGLDFVVLPATQTSLAILIETFQTKQSLMSVPQNGAPLFPEMLRRRPLLYLERLAPEPAAVEQLGAQLHAFLGDDGYDWLAACAVYPMLAWDITLYLGHRLTDANGQKLLTETRLLALARLPWFRHGSMPDWLRLQLIRSLAPEQERAVRQALEDLLKSADDQIRDGVPLDIAHPPKDWKLRAWKKRLRDLLLAAPEDSALQDYVFLTFMSGRKPRQLALTAPDSLRRVLFRRGLEMLGLRPATVLATMLVSAIMAWKIISMNPPTLLQSFVLPRFEEIEESSDRLAESDFSDQKITAARSDSAWSYYVENFLKQQSKEFLDTLIARYLPEDVGFETTFLSNDDSSSIQKRFELYQNWLTNTLRQGAQISIVPFSFTIGSASDTTKSGLIEWKSRYLYLILKAIKRDTTTIIESITSTDSGVVSAGMAIAESQPPREQSVPPAIEIGTLTIRREGLQFQPKLLPELKNPNIENPLAAQTHESNPESRGDNKEPSFFSKLLQYIVPKNYRPTRVESASINDVFASLYKCYSRSGSIGTIKVKNMYSDTLVSEISFRENHYLIATGPDSVVLPPETTVDFPLRTVFKNEIFYTPESRFTAEIEVSYEYRKDVYSSVSKVAFKVHPKNYLIWDDPRKAVAFVTYDDPIVQSFVNEVLMRKPQFDKTNWIYRYNIDDALTIFNALTAYGLQYRADPLTPFPSLADSLRGSFYRLDMIQYPAELLSSRSPFGDCDDLSVLYASLLQNAGIPTAMVSSPGHIFMMFETNVPSSQSRILPISLELFVERNGYLWIPVETTMISSGFVEAWITAAERFKEIRNKNLVEIFEVAASQAIYPPVSSSVLKSPSALPKPIPDFAQNLLNDFDRMNDLKQQYLQTFEASLKRNLSIEEERKIRNLYGVVLAKDNQYTLAANQFQRILIKDSTYAAAWNNSGNVEFIYGNFSRAERFYKNALVHNRFSTGTYLNLAILYQMMISGAVPRDSVYYQRQSDEALLQAIRLLEGDSNRAFDILGVPLEVLDAAAPKGQGSSNTRQRLKQIKMFIDRSFEMYLQKREIKGVVLDRHGAKGVREVEESRGELLYWSYQD